MSERLAALLTACSNAGRWSEDDELGTLNLITPEKRIQAAGLVREGVSVSLAAELSLVHGPFSDGLTSHVAFTDPASPVAVADTVTLNVHGWSTHLDAAGHIYVGGVGYNGRRREDIFGSTGLQHNAVTAMREGIFTRGVLLDVAAARGVPWLPSDDLVTPVDLEQAEARAGVRVEAGDALLVHTGLATRLSASPGTDPDHRAGLDVDSVVWLHERDVAVFGGDCIERLPSRDPDLALPLHELGIAAMGLVLLDWPRLNELLEACRRWERHEFLITAAPLPIARGTGSPVNPIATF